ncbi:MAG: zinc ribbon domain-containing protein [Abditibacteriota bacterium]|nr:zinc ribbon domain-containing protein [Abditibacteriota bacterium]
MANFCKYCGNENPDDATVCRGCGEPIKDAKVIIRCPKCGAVMSEDGVCPECGSKLLIDKSKKKKPKEERFVEMTYDGELILDDTEEYTMRPPTRHEQSYGTQPPPRHEPEINQQKMEEEAEINEYLSRARWIHIDPNEKIPKRPLTKEEAEVLRDDVAQNIAESQETDVMPEDYESDRFFGEKKSKPWLHGKGIKIDKAKMKKSLAKMKIPALVALILIAAAIVFYPSAMKALDIHRTKKAFDICTRVISGSQEEAFATDFDFGGIAKYYKSIDLDVMKKKLIVRIDTPDWMAVTYDDRHEFLANIYSAWSNICKQNKVDMENVRVDIVNEKGYAEATATVTEGIIQENIDVIKNSDYKPEDFGFKERKDK